TAAMSPMALFIPDHTCLVNLKTPIMISGVRLVLAATRFHYDLGGGIEYHKQVVEGAILRVVPTL
ncbi:hypothetical protein IFM89_029733, partial [Coptis chinensis]